MRCAGVVLSRVVDLVGIRANLVPMSNDKLDSNVEFPLLIASIHNGHGAKSFWS